MKPIRPLWSADRTSAVLAVIVALLLGASVVLVGVNLGRLPGALWVLTAVVIATIVVGEIWRTTVLEPRDAAPVAVSAALALAMTGTLPGGLPVGSVASLVVLATGAASLLGNLVRHQLSGEPVAWADVGLRVLMVSITVVLFRVVPISGETILQRVDGRPIQGWWVAGVMLVVGAVALVVNAAVDGARRAARDHRPMRQTIVESVMAGWILDVASVSTAAVIALAVGAIGPVAVPLFMTPLVLLQLAVSRQTLARATSRQTVFALSRLTELGGFTPPGHAARVARLVVPMGRDLSVPERELADLEYAALLHDLGQVVLPRPIPGGATINTAPLDQRRIAATAASILARTSELIRLAPVVSQQAAPFRSGEDSTEVQLQAAILKVANAFDDLVGPRTEAGVVLGALERIRMGTSTEYDPRAVTSLCRVLLRDGRLSDQARELLDVQI